MSATGFTIHHLPYGVITTSDNQTPCLATAYEDYAINLAILVKQGFFNDSSDRALLEDALSQQTWNTFAALPPSTRQRLRTALKSYITSLPSTPPPTTSTNNNHHASSWHPLQSTTLHYPMQTTNYSDFYCSLEHARNCSAVFNLPISPTWYTLPQVYNGRTSSLAITNTPITRPCGIFPLPSTSTTGEKPAATFQPETKLDFELEMGIFISTSVPRGQRLAISNAKNHIFGIALLNDWSARCIQFYEIQPLGPFHSKGALTSVAGWITPIEALEEDATCQRMTTQEVTPLPHLSVSQADVDSAAWNVEVSACVVRDGREYEFTRSNLAELYWTPLQQITHLASAGEGLSTGDVFGTGTLSSSRVNGDGEKIGLGCIWERQLGDARLKGLPQGVEERLLEDGDEVVLRGWVERGGEVLFRLGECRGVVLPAVGVGEGEK